MRCGLRAMSVLRVRCRVLMLAVAPTAVFAQSLVCHRDSAWRVRHHTSRNASPATAGTRISRGSRSGTPRRRFVPKSQYDRIRAGWQACVIKPADPNRGRRTQLPSKQPSLRSLGELPSDQRCRRSTRDSRSRQTSLPRVRNAVASGVLRTIGQRRSHAGVAWRSDGRAVVRLADPRRLSRSPEGRRRSSCGTSPHRFVREFERPLIQQHDASVPCERGSAAVALGGGSTFFSRRAQGRRYPNLSDHKKNLEYDVARSAAVARPTTPS